MLGGVKSENVLLLITICSIILGAVVGYLLNPSLSIDTDSPTLLYLAFPGQLFIRMLNLMIVPLVISSNVSSAASVRGSRWLAGFSMLYYILTTLGAVLIGTALALLIQPGTDQQHHTEGSLRLTGKFRASHAVFSAMDLLRNMIPDNPVEAAISRTRTAYSLHKQAENEEVEEEAPSSIGDHVLAAFNATKAEIESSLNVTARLESVVTQENKWSDERVRGANILGLICFSIFFGFTIRKLLALDPEAQWEVRCVLGFFSGLRRIMVYLVSIIIWFSPLGIASLIASQLAQTKDLGEAVRQLGMYTLTVMIGLTIHVLCVLAPILAFIGRRNPLFFGYHMLQAVMIAGGTASSMATLPVTANCLEHNVKIDNRVMRFMLPLGTTVNMDGTALYQMVAILYVARIMRVEMEAGMIAFIVVLVVMSSIATASVPSAGYVSMVLTMQAIGLPEDAVKIVMVVDWFLDRLRTPVNVLSNAVGVAVVAERCKERLKMMNPPLLSASIPNGHALPDTQSMKIEIESGDDNTRLPDLLPSTQPYIPSVALT